MKKNTVFKIIFSGFLLLMLIYPAAADNSSQFNYSFPTPEYTFTPVNVTPWYPQTGEYSRYWFDYDDTGDFLPYSFLSSVALPYTDILSGWFFVGLWIVYLVGVWNRERGIELTIVMMLITGSLWGLLMPFESFWVLLVMMALGISAIVFRLVKR